MIEALRSLGDAADILIILTDQLCHCGQMTHSLLGGLIGGELKRGQRVPFFQFDEFERDERLLPILDQSAVRTRSGDPS